MTTVRWLAAGVAVLVLLLPVAVSLGWWLRSRTVRSDREALTRVMADYNTVAATNARLRTRNEELNVELARARSAGPMVARPMIRPGSHLHRPWGEVNRQEDPGVAGPGRSGGAKHRKEGP